MVLEPPCAPGTWAESTKIKGMLRKLAALALCGLPAAAQYDGPKEPLCRAAYRGDVTKVTALLADGADPNVRDEDGFTPLIRAAAVVRPPEFSGGDG